MAGLVFSQTLVGCKAKLKLLSEWFRQLTLNFNQMKLKYGLILLALGYCLDFIGSWMKIVHRQYATEILTASTVIKIIAVLVILFKILGNQKLKDVLNS
jgi:hypothetical protein